jgi:anti-sigma regulatory factor (Ser/Thr protein kinase)
VPVLRSIKLLAHPLFIAGIFVLGTAPFTLKLIPKYKVKLTNTLTYSRPNTAILWADFQDDGESEKLEWFMNSESKATYKINNQSGYLLDQQVFEGQSLTNKNSPFIADLNRNGFPEIYTFYHRNDSLFFKGLEYLHDIPRTLVNERFVTLVRNLKGMIDYNISFYPPAYYSSIENESALVFSVNAGYPVIPRYIYKYNPVTETLHHSDFFGAVNTPDHHLDVNGDGKKEYLISQYAPGNLRDSLINGENDTYVRLILLDDSLKTIWKTDPLGTIYSGIGVYPYQIKGKFKLVAFLGNSQVPELNGILSVFSADGKLIISHDIKTSVSDINNILLYSGEDDPSIKILDSEGFLKVYNLSLGLVKKNKVPYSHGALTQLDIDGDGERERIIFSEDVTILRQDLTHPATLRFPHESSLNNYVYLKKNHNRPNEISVQYGNRYSLISYLRNPFYPFRIPGLFALWGVLGGVIFMMQFLQRLALREKYMTERRLMEMQLLLLRNQINPHFLFNAINSISYRLMEKDPEEANNNVIRLSRLIQHNLTAADKFSRSLKDELEAAESYAEIVRSQMEEPFELIVEVAPETDMNIQVPVMVIQNYLENAIKHGVRTLGKEGKISVRISGEAKTLLIMITDNGIGRPKAAENRSKIPSTGKGMDLMDRFFAEVNKANEREISLTIRDLTDDSGNPAGTEVLLEIPISMKYRVYDN